MLLIDIARFRAPDGKIAGSTRFVLLPQAVAVVTASPFPWNCFLQSAALISNLPLTQYLLLLLYQIWPRVKDIVHGLLYIIMSDTLKFETFLESWLDGFCPHFNDLKDWWSGRDESLIALGKTYFFSLKSLTRVPFSYMQLQFSHTTITCGNHSNNNPNGIIECLLCPRHSSEHFPGTNPFSSIHYLVRAITCFRSQLS